LGARKQAADFFSACFLAPNADCIFRKCRTFAKSDKTAVYSRLIPYLFHYTIKISAFQHFFAAIEKFSADRREARICAENRALALGRRSNPIAYNLD
jgi:hypothetical protein